MITAENLHEEISSKDNVNGSPEIHSFQISQPSRVVEMHMDRLRCLLSPLDENDKFDTFLLVFCLE